jgi:hypothetical protein
MAISNSRPGRGFGNVSITAALDMEKILALASRYLSICGVFR